MQENTYKQLVVWQKSIVLTKDIYLLTNKLPKSELYVLTSQMRRAAISIPSNIAEGQGKKSRNEFVRYINISLGSATELETQLILVQEIYKISTISIQDQIVEIKKMLNGLINKLKVL